MIIRGRYQYQANLAPYTSWRIGGLAEHLYCPVDLDDLICLLRNLPLSTQLTLIGLGSNMLIRDRGISGVVIVTSSICDDLSLVTSQDDHSIIYATLGTSCAKLARFSVRLGLTGLEFLATIPGTVGGALVMNAGCFGAHIWQYVDQVLMLTRQGELYKQDTKHFIVKYRFVSGLDHKYFAGAYFKLPIGNKDRSFHLINYFLAKRKENQPINYRTCGSVFCNPTNHFAGRLIEDCGLKGYTRGNASVSLKHANFIINHGGAIASDVEYIIQHIITIVANKYNQILVPEVKIIGDL